jgi:Mrp family chromosome partitioning ATPase
VLIDSPPVAAVTDALLLAQRADSTLLVVQQNKVDRAMVKRAVAALRRVAPNLIGAVLNAVDVTTKGYYGYAYYGSGRAAGDPHTSEPDGGASEGKKRPGVTDASLV